MQAECAVGKVDGIVRFKRERLIKVRHGSFVFSQPEIREPAVVVIHAVGGVEGYGLREQFFGFIEIAVHKFLTTLAVQVCGLRKRRFAVRAGTAAGQRKRKQRRSRADASGNARQSFQRQECG